MLPLEKSFLRRSLPTLLQCQDRAEFLVLLELREEEFFHGLCLARLLYQFCCMEGNAFRTEVPESNVQVRLVKSTDLDGLVGPVGPLP